MMTRYSSPQYKGILIELKNVIITSSFKEIRLPVYTWKSILCCGATAEYQCGRITEDEYYTRLAKDFELSRQEVIDAFNIVRGTLQIDQSVLSFLAQVKARFHGALRVYAMGNLSREDYELARTLPMDWDLFDGVFTSGAAGMRKPELRFFHHVLDSIHMLPNEVILIDDDTDHVLTALSLGMQGILSTSSPISRTLLNLVEDDTIGRARQFLHKNAKKLHSVTHTGVTIRENYAQLLILEATDDLYIITSLLILKITLTLSQGLWLILNPTRLYGIISSVFLPLPPTQKLANLGIRQASAYTGQISQ